MKRRRASMRRSARQAALPAGADGDTSVRIVGGRLRGRRLGYSGDPRVRPMKDRTREAVFNLLGPSVAGTVVLDLFAGTGAMALEALSRGAKRALLVERHIPTAKTIEQTISSLNLADRVSIVRADTFYWIESFCDDLPQAAESAPWLVFCCPPYDVYREQFEALRHALTRLRDASTPDSRLVVEAERPFEFTSLWPGRWTEREYAPAAIGIYTSDAER